MLRHPQGSRMLRRVGRGTLVNMEVRRSGQPPVSESELRGWL